MKTIMAIAMVLLVAGLPLVLAQESGSQSGSEGVAESQAVSKPFIRNLHISGKGVFMPEELSDTLMLKIVLGGVVTPSGREISSGIMNTDGIGMAGKYKMDNVVIGEGTASADILDRVSGEFAGSLEVERVSFGIEKVEDAWIGTMTLDGVEGKVYILAAKRGLKQAERQDFIQRARAQGLEGTDSEVLIDYAVERIDRDQRFRTFIREECSRTEHEGTCKQSIAKHPKAAARAVEALPVRVAERVVDADIDPRDIRGNIREGFERKVVRIPSTRITVEQEDTAITTDATTAESI